MKIILVDDHKITREGIKALLDGENDIEIVGEANNGKELIREIDNLMPDLILLDANMPEMDGLEVLQYLKENNKHIKVLILTMTDDEAFIKKIINAGANGYILKTCSKDELLDALKTVNRGGMFLSTEITLKLLNKVNGDVQRAAAPGQKQPNDISKRELEVLELIAEGFTNGQIADKLFTSKRTIESHRRNLIEKTGTKNTAELIKYALSKGIIDFAAEYH